jgi:hypothetical protein
MRPVGSKGAMTMTRFLIVCLFAASFALPVTPALAQEDEETSAGEGNVRYRKKTEIDFEDVLVDGELKKPHGAYLLDKRQSSFNPLIRMKEDFNTEMIESVNQIR